MAKQRGDTEWEKEIRQEMTAYSKTNPGKKITRKTRRRSAKARETNSGKLFQGINVPKKDKDYLKEGRYALTF